MNPETTDKLIAAGEKLVERLSEIGSQYGPKAVDLANNVYFVSALNDLLFALTWVVLCGLSSFLAIFGSRMAKNAEANRNDSDGWVALMIFGIVGAVIAAILAVMSLSNAWMWVGLFHPEVLMAKQVLGL